MAVQHNCASSLMRMSVVTKSNSLRAIRSFIVSPQAVAYHATASVTSPIMTVLLEDRHVAALVSHS
jgi:hypothetical protein